MELKTRIENKIQQAQWLSPIFLRFGIGSVFLIFGADKFIHLNAWIAYMPLWLTNLLPIPLNIFMYIQGVFEALLGLFLIIGFWTKTSAFLCAGILLMITLSLGYNEITVRDFGLLLGCIALCLQKQIRWSVDGMILKR